MNIFYLLLKILNYLKVIKEINFEYKCAQLINLKIDESFITEFNPNGFVLLNSISFIGFTIPCDEILV